MKIFNKPEKLNGTELMAELSESGIIVDRIIDFANGTIGFETDDEIKAAEIVENHNGTIVAPDLAIKRQALLNKLGITEDEAKLLLS